MLTKRDLSYIDTLDDLRLQKKKALQEIDDAERHLEEIFEDLPLKFLGNTVGFVAGAVAKGFQGPFQKEKEASEDGPQPENFTDTLRAVGEETAYFALAKLVEKLLAKG